MKFEKINRYTRAGRFGKFIQCSFCKKQAMVYHFNWCDLTCNHCKKMVAKYDWLVEVAA